MFAWRAMSPNAFLNDLGLHIGAYFTACLGP